MVQDSEWYHWTACQARISNKNDFFKISFSPRSYGGLKICELQPNFLCFVHIFRSFCLIFDQFLLKYDEIVEDSLIEFTFIDKRKMMNCLNQLFQYLF